MSAKIITIAIEKGGTGKTVTASNFIVKAEPAVYVLNKQVEECQHAGSTRVVRGTGRRIKKTFIFGKLLV